MGIDVADYNRDGLPDILVTNCSLEGAALFRNDGREFTEVSIRSRSAQGNVPLYRLGEPGCSTMTTNADLDIFIANGHPEDTIEISHSPSPMPNPNSCRRRRMASSWTCWRPQGRSIAKPPGPAALLSEISTTTGTSTPRR